MNWDMISILSVESRVEDPGGLYPDPDQNFEKKPGPTLKKTFVFTFDIKVDIINILIIYCNFGQLKYSKKWSILDFECSDWIRILCMIIFKTRTLSL